MKNSYRGALAFLFLVNALALPSCSPSDNGIITINVANSDDYIDPTLTKRFIAYVKEKDGVDVRISYSVFSTAEEILSKVTAGTANYDLVCNSDYIIQKMMGLNMLEKFATGEEREKLYGESASWWEDTYEHYASPYLQNLLYGITMPVATENGSETHHLSDYARGYMWGTLGITYNSTFYKFAERGLSEDQVKVQMADWDSLWDERYAGTFQIKDSMRDTFAIGLMHVFNPFFKALREDYVAGHDKSGAAYSAEAYQKDVSMLFNCINHVDSFNALAKKIKKEAQNPSESLVNLPDTYTVESIIKLVKESIKELKDNSFGMEVDSGKVDITNGNKSGIDTAWSGDAIISMDTGDANAKEDVNIYYSIPKTGGNIWSDNWVMLKENINGDARKKEYCQKFIDYLSNPEIASENMQYIGYTSFIGGDSILDVVRDWYDARTFEMYQYDDEASDFVYDEYGEKKYIEGMEGSTYEMAMVNGTSMGWSDYSKENELGWMDVDLSYFFDGTFDDYEDGIDSHFYSNEIEEITATNLYGEEETVLVGRQFLAQYPTEDEAYKGSSLCQIPSLSVMEDYGDNGTKVLDMWEEIKSSSLPLWAIILFVTEAVVAISVGLAFFFGKKATKKLRQRRRENKAQNE